MKKKGQEAARIEVIQECFSVQMTQTKKDAGSSQPKRCCQQIKLPCNISLPSATVSSEPQGLMSHQFAPDQTLMMPASIAPQNRGGEGSELLPTRVIPLKGHRVGCKHLEGKSSTASVIFSSSHRIRLLSQSTSAEEGIDWNMRQEERQFRMNRIISYVPLNQ